MSSRGGRRRGRPPKTVSTPPTFINARANSIEKPKWLQAANNSREGSESPAGSVGSRQYSARKHISVTPFRKRGRKAGTRGNRGGKAYLPRPSLVTRDYHYGSDFDSGSGGESEPEMVEDEELDVESDDDLMPDISEAETDIIDEDGSDSLSINSGLVAKNKQVFAPTPLPYWLQSDQELPTLNLPESSDDLLLPLHQVLPACAVYEVLRKFSSEVRLSPFRLEEFMAAVQSEELTTLLAEIHVQLLKSMLREEDAQQTWFGPLDQKDSTNSMLHFTDGLTWPEVLRVYMQSDPAVFGPALQLLESCEYPFTSCDIRLRVLKFLTDHFLCNTAVRQELLSEGNIKYNDHCRVCHKVGDLLCCETCPAVYHLHCLDPPLDTVPPEDWQCPICTAQLCRGVTDCISDVERSGFLCRQDCLGYDRHGRKYWFISRRIFVEEDAVEELGDVKAENRKTWYYSSPHQLDRLLSLLDRTEYEKVLCQELVNLRPEILRQMAITVSLTNEFKGKNKSYLEVEEETAKQEAIKEEETEEIEPMETDQVVKTETGIEKEEEVVEECGVEVDDDDFMQQLRVDAEETKSKEIKTEPESTAEGSTYSTRTKTGTIVPRSYASAAEKRVASAANGEKKSDSAKSSPLPTDVLFKLGMEGRHKTYVNHYSTNALALNKNQAAEERDRKRYLSHKFSLTGTGEFKWIGATSGQRSSLLTTVRTTLLQLHSQMPATFMHTNWAHMRKSWITAVNSCVSPQDLGRVLSILAACVRPVAFTSVWHESLGHIRLQRQTALEREEKKKLDKKEKKEKELEEEMNRLHTVHYTKGLKHQIWKHKGEEFRLHGQWGWRWLSATRPYRRQDYMQCGLRAGPWRIVCCSQEDGEETASFVHSDPGNGKVPYEIPLDDPAMEVVDVSAALTDPDRRIYSKMAKKGRLDGLLDWRLKLKAAEEKNLLTKVPRSSSAQDDDEEVDVESDGSGCSKLTSRQALERLEKLQAQRLVHPQCYSSSCRPGATCYSPTCRSVTDLIVRVQHDKVEAERRQKERERMELEARIYSGEKTSAPISLKRLGLLLASASDESSRLAKKKKPLVKYPMMSTYTTTKSKKRTIFVLAGHELRHLARRRGQGYVQGFHHGSKNNSTAWFYPSSRPLFKTCWFYRTNGLPSLSAAALQLRILWACLRWEEMNTKTGGGSSGAVGVVTNMDGKNQQTTETEIVTTDILKHRHVGRFLERTQYFQRRVVIPLDVPKTVREVTPSRSGLRKRKMVEAPRLSQPIVTEEWVDEDRLDLWVIKHYHERMERAATATATSAATTLTSNLNRLKGSTGTTGTMTGPGGKTMTMEEMKEKAEQQLRAQRAAHQLKTGGTSPAVGTPGKPQIIRLGSNIQTTNRINMPQGKTIIRPMMAGQQFIVTPDGKRQLLRAAAAPAAGTPILIAPSPIRPVGTPAAASSISSKLQITRGADGKIQIRGLQPGQQLLRMADGRFSIVTSSPATSAASPVQIIQAAKPMVTASDATAATTATAVDSSPKTIILKASTAGGVPLNAIAGQKIITTTAGNANNLTQQLALASGKIQLPSVNGQQMFIQTMTNPATGQSVQVPAGGQPKQMMILPQGQRIVVQNLQGGSLTPQQLLAIQEQLKLQMAKQANAGTNSKTPITIAVRSVSGASASSASVVTTTTTTTTATTSTPSTPVVTATAAASATTSPNSPTKGGDKQFVVTQDFIQQTIRKALKQENLNPEIEQKLLILQRFQESQKKEDGHETVAAVTDYHHNLGAVRKRTISSTNAEEFGALASAIPVTPRPPARKTPIGTPVSSTASEELREQRNRERSMKAQQRNKERRFQNAQARLQGVLNKQAELLKKEMLRKRALLEKELRQSINKELAALVPPRHPSPPKQQPALPSPPIKKEKIIKTEQQTPVKKTPPQRKKRKASPDRKTPIKLEKEVQPSSTKKKKRNSSGNASGGVGEGGDTASADDGGDFGGTKLYCVCRTPYDNTKFYVGCDHCSNWFHGDCVGITEAMSQTMSEFVCDGCDRERSESTRQLYCLCRKPYDESQFYICCDRCQDWMHGRCVGVVQTESESIDEYVCPRCDPARPFNYANTRPLAGHDYEELRKVVRQLQTHKSSWPFRVPVNEKDVPDYYLVIKDPMDLRTVDTKISERRYQRLVDFVADITRIFDNCRYYNAKESSFARCATALESFFVPRLKVLRSSMGNV